MLQSELGNFLINYYNREEFLDLKKEIWTRGEYFFEPSETEEKKFNASQTNYYSPLIFDCGTHIGLASLYWLYLYPEAKIWAFEPNPFLYSILKQNIEQNYLSEKIKIFPLALAEKAGEKEFFIDTQTEDEKKWFMSGSFFSGAWNHQQPTQAIKVNCGQLSQYLAQSLIEEKRPMIDLVKIDIEGAEGEVLREAGDFLPKIKRLMIEYHPAPGQKIARLLKLLEMHNFAFEITGVDDGQSWSLQHNYEPKKLLFIEAINKNFFKTSPF